MAVLIMAQQTNNASSDDIINNKHHHHHKLFQLQQEAKAMFHDFLGTKNTTDSPLLPKTTSADAASPSASASAGAARGPPLSSASDIASERHVGNHLEGIPYYGPRSDISGPEISNRLVGSKRSNSDSAFTGSSRDGIPLVSHDSLEQLHLMKMLRSGGGGERPRRSADDEIFYGMQPVRPTSASLILQPSSSSRLDVNVSKWERSIPMGAAVQYHPRGGQFVPFSHQVPANRVRDTNAGPSVISQLAADEGSRTGIKGPGILSSINAGSSNSDKNLSGALLSGSKPKSVTHTSEPESLTPSSRQGLTSASHQMTIFYGGQAHVFDDVHPNKADVIMALAGSNGGSWSTTFSSKPIGRPGSDCVIGSGEYEGANTLFQREFRERLALPGNAAQGGGSSGRISMPIGGGGHGSISKESRNPVQRGEPSTEEK